MLLETPYPASAHQASQALRLGVGVVSGASPVADNHLQGVTSDSAERSPSESWSTGSDEALGAP